MAFQTFVGLFMLFHTSFFYFILLQSSNFPLDLCPMEYQQLLQTTHMCKQEMIIQLSYLKGISHKSSLLTMSSYRKKQTKKSRNEFQTLKMIQVLFCLWGHTGTELQAYIVWVNILCPHADHHCIEGPLYNKSITQIQKLPAVYCTMIQSLGTEVSKYLVNCGQCDINLPIVL